MNLVKSFAQRYSWLGWSVIPINDRSKLPAIKSWTEFQQRPPTPEEMNRWPWPNVGVVTGRVSGVCVIDEDDLDALSPADREKTDAFLNLLPPTATAITGKGRHRYFAIPRQPSQTAVKAPSEAAGGVEAVGTASVTNASLPSPGEALEVVPTRVRFLPGLDSRGEGGYALAPPSVHPTGHVYTWAADKEPEDGLAVLPDWALDIISGCKDVESRPLWETSLEGVVEGDGRNAAAASLIGKLVSGKSKELLPFIWESVKSWNQRNKPPLSQKELKMVFDSICKREAKGKTPTTPAIAKVENALVPYRARDLLNLERKPHIITDFIPAGFATLAGKPKVGKSRLALQIALSVATGAPPFNSLVLNAHHINGKVQKGHVLFIALEDTPGRLGSRLKDMVGEHTELVDNIFVYESFPTLFAGGIERLSNEIEKDPDLRLVIIDTLAAFSGAGQGGGRSNESAFTVEYRCVAPILDIVKGKNVAVMVIQHARKDVTSASNPDPFDSVSGTLGTSAVADTLMVLYQQRLRGKPPQTLLAGKGRDIEGFELPMVSKGAIWSIGETQQEDDE